METKWYAVYTKPRWEKKVSDGLCRSRIENYCPLNKVVRQWSDRKKTIEEPLFTSYVFVKINANDHTNVRRVDGVVNFVYWLGKPAVIRDEEINSIRDFLKEYSNVSIQKVSAKVDDQIKITSGPFAEMVGRVIAVKTKTVKVLLPTLGYILTAEVKKGEIRVMASEFKQSFIW
ncbi:MAG TPA: UpxY family transcription antiterminator [Sphingobacteriaceae bacterium]